MAREDPPGMKMYFLLEKVDFHCQVSLLEGNSLHLKIDLLEKEIPIGNHHFQVQTLSFREGIACE